MSIDRGDVLLKIARAAISEVLKLPMTAEETAPWLMDLGACFVTLTKNGDLRGCIGSLQAHRSLLNDVKSNAVAAALYDPRFSPLTRDELHSTDIEISLLSPTQSLEFISESNALSQLRPGVDGVIFEFSRHQSTFLPQVWAQLPQPHQFMAHLKLKSGLPADFWDEGVKLSRYTVTHFSDKTVNEQTGAS
jgi:AmmeMemoRadiSam system protein A